MELLIGFIILFIVCAIVCGLLAQRVAAPKRPEKPAEKDKDEKKKDKEGDTPDGAFHKRPRPPPGMMLGGAAATAGGGDPLLSYKLRRLDGRGVPHAEKNKRKWGYEEDQLDASLQSMHSGGTSPSMEHNISGIDPMSNASLGGTVAQQATLDDEALTPTAEMASDRRGTGRGSYISPPAGAPVGHVSPRRHGRDPHHRRDAARRGHRATSPARRSGSPARRGRHKPDHAGSGDDAVLSDGSAGSLSDSGKRQTGAHVYPSRAYTASGDQHGDMTHLLQQGTKSPTRAAGQDKRRAHRVAPSAAHPAHPAHPRSPASHRVRTASPQHHPLHHPAAAVHGRRHDRNSHHHHHRESHHHAHHRDSHAETTPPRRHRTDNTNPDHASPTAPAPRSSPAKTVRVKDTWVMEDGGMGDDADMPRAATSHPSRQNGTKEKSGTPVRRRRGSVGAERPPTGGRRGLSKTQY